MEAARGVYFAGWVDVVAGTLGVAGVAAGAGVVVGGAVSASTRVARCAAAGVVGM